MMKKRRILNEYQLERLKEHKYAAEGSSLLDPYMQPFWKWLVEQIPLTWAPNAITLWGLIGNILSTIFLMLYCPNGFGEAPWWCYTLCAVFLFVYQSLDAIDGKQARRTGSSSPLGELFDHGCDAMSIVIIIVGVCIATQIGSSPYMFSLVTFITMTIFYAAQWRTFATGVMKFGLLDVTEGQVAVTAIYLFDAIFGVSIWNQEVILGLKVNQILWLGTSVFGISILSNFLLVIYRADDTNASESNDKTVNKPTSKSGCCEEEAKKLKSLVSRRYVPAIPMGIFFFFGFSCCFFSASGVLENNVVLYHVMFGVVATKLCCLVLVSHMTKTDMPCLDSIFIGPFLLLLAEMLRFPEETCFLWMAFFYNIINLLVHVSRVCSDICDHLDIYCFKIAPPQSHSNSSPD